jgi:O-antigen/teichoic acid export membrane protein
MHLQKRDACLKFLLKKAGVDEAIGYSVLSRVLQAGGGIISILFISRYLDSTEQGFYYTFGSLIGIQLFFELGFTQVITQFVAHEAAQVKWEDGSLYATEYSLSRLSSLLYFTLKWFAIMSISLGVILIMVGFVFFTRFHGGSGNVQWEAPFVILSLATAASLFITPILAYLEGLGKVKEVAIIRFYQQACYLLLLFSFFFFGFKLYAAPLAQLVNFLIPFCLILFSNNYLILKDIFRKKGEFAVNYKKEIFPYQGRIAISWISGFFIFQLFNPVLFATAGPVAAGQMGMTISVLNGIMALSYTWINTKTPLFSKLIARKQYGELDTIFKQTNNQAILVCFLALSFFIMGVLLLKYFEAPLANRFLNNTALILVCIATLGNQVSYGMATYLRCHKKEPLMVQTISMALLMILLMLVLGKLFGVNGIAFSYCVLTSIIGVSWTYYTFRTKRRQWHEV